MKYSRCNQGEKLMTVQALAVEKAIERNRYYLGELAHHYIKQEKAATDFFTNHVLPYWGEIFKSLFCTYKCPERYNCEIEEKHHPIAEIFRREVEKFGIDKVLEGGNETEAIFTRYREIVQSRESSTQNLTYHPIITQKT